MCNEARSEIFAEDLNPIFASWARRKPRSLHLTIIRDLNVFCEASLVVKKENMKVIENYEKMGVIKIRVTDGF
jgi:hypothetical protein